MAAVRWPAAGEGGRPVKRRTSREGPVHREILNVLRLRLPAVEAATLHHARNEIAAGNNSDQKIKIAMANAKRMGMCPGWPDLQWLGRGGRLHAIEVKAPKKKPTDTQFEVGAAIVAAGGRWAWTDSGAGAEAILAEWGYR